jgi:uncharacterized membrane protein YjjP (DUF1212 family)
VSHDDFPDLISGEYGVIRIPDAWHVLSLLCFLAALGARFLTSLLPREMSALVFRPLLTAVAVPAIALLGILFGLLGLRNPQGRSTARVALFLNGVTLVLGALAVAAFYYILPG